MKYDKNQIYCKQLPTPVIVKNFIDGQPKDYEEYLLEFINLSKLVEELGNEEFILRKHSEQSQGQSDIFNTQYELDFKILVDTKYMEAKSMLSASISEWIPGCTSIGPSKMKGSMQAYDIIKCLRNKTIEELTDIKSGILKIPEGPTIKKTLNKISVNKNILFFVPFNYYIKNEETEEDIAKFILECISYDLKSLIEYRNNKVNKHTYLAFISNDYFIIGKESHNLFILYDMIKTNQSNVYNYLNNVGKLQ